MNTPSVWTTWKCTKEPSVAWKRCTKVTLPVWAPGRPEDSFCHLVISVTKMRWHAVSASGRSAMTRRTSYGAVKTPLPHRRVGQDVITKVESDIAHAPRGDGGGGVAAANNGLALGQGGPAQSAKATLVAQQCALECGVHPELDPGLCTQKCATECMSATDLASIEACAKRLAAP